MKYIDILTSYLCGFNFKAKLLKSYKYAKFHNDIEILGHIKKNIFLLPLNISKEKYSHLIFGASSHEAERVLIQFICNIGDFYRINKFILLGNNYKNKKLVIAIPPQWVNYLRDNQFNVGVNLSYIFWIIIVLSYFIHGIYIIFKIMIESLVLYRNKERESFVYFFGLQKTNTPYSSNEVSFDLISSFIERGKLSPSIKLVYHSAKNSNQCLLKNGVRIIYRKKYLPFMAFNELLLFLKWSFLAISLCVIDLFRGRWWHALLLAQSAYASQYRFSKRNRSISEYIYNNSDWLFKPLWTYEAEKQNSRVSLLFYSTNNEEPLLKGRSQGFPAGLKGVTWNYYYVWDEYQRSFLEKFVSSSNVEYSISGFFGLSDDDLIVDLKNKKNIISVFDITPHKFINSSAYLDVGNLLSNHHAVSFIRDIYMACNHLECTMIWKTKRRFGNITHKGFQYFHKNFFENKSNVIKVDSEVSPIKLISTSIGVISRPYTSTALIAKYLNIPSIYYDPTGLLQLDDPAAHGIKIIQSTDDLYMWIKNIARI
jgi:polysaccharide biosynthesis PFTS motif protein